MKKILGTVALISILLITGCQGNVTVPQENTKPLFGMHTLDVVVEDTSNIDVTYHAFDVNPESEYENQLHLYYAITSTSGDLVQSRYLPVDNVGDSMVNGENNFTVSLDEIESEEDYCGKTYSIYAQLNPTQGEIWNSDTSTTVDKHIEESSSLSLGPVGQEEYTQQVTIVCESEALVQPTGIVDLAATPVNKDPANSKPENTYVKPGDVDIQEVYKKNQKWYVLYKGVASSPNMEGLNSTWFAKLNVFSSDWEHLSGPRRVIPNSTDMGMAGRSSLVSITDDEEGNVVGIRHWNKRWRMDDDIDERLNSTVIEEAPTAYDIAYRENGSYVITDRPNLTQSEIEVYDREGQHLRTVDVNDILTHEGTGYIHNIGRFENKWVVGSWRGPPGRFHVFSDGLEYIGSTTVSGPLGRTDSFYIEESSGTLYNAHDKKVVKYDVSDIIQTASLT